jgi:tetratricopeptide (TPR) repeat protein
VAVVIVAAWMFRSAVKDVFEFVSSLWRLLVTLVRLVTPGRVKRVGKPQRSQRLCDIQECEEAADFNRYAELIETASGDEVAEYLYAGIGSLAAQYAQVNDNDGLAQLLGGAELVKSAYAARGTSVASQTSTAQTNEFMRLIDKADIALNDALELLQTHPDLSFQEECSMALYPELLSVRRAQGDKSAAYACYHAAVSMQPNYLRVHAVMLNVLSERWLGEAGEGLALAQKLGGLSGPLPELVPIAHIEHWMDLDDAKGYFKTDAIGGQLEVVLEYVKNKTYSGNWAMRHNRVLALNALAFCFCMAKQHHQAQRVFAELGGGFTSFPWRYLGESPEKVYLDFRDEYI